MYTKTNNPNNFEVKKHDKIDYCDKYTEVTCFFNIFENLFKSEFEKYLL